MMQLSLHGIDALATAVVLLDDAQVVRYINPAAENLLAISAKNIVGTALEKVFAEPGLLGCRGELRRREQLQPHAA